MSKIFYIMGKSASGKDKIYKYLMKSEELNLQQLVLYTTRPIRVGEENGKQYFFVDENRRKELEAQGKLIESRSYNTVHGIWSYFTADEGIDLKGKSYLGIGTLESYRKMVEYYGEDVMCPIYIEVEDGERLRRAIKRESKEECPKYEEVCRRFLADSQDFSDEKIREAGIEKRFENIVLDDCIQEIVQYISGKK